MLRRRGLPGLGIETPVFRQPEPIPASYSHDLPSGRPIGWGRGEYAAGRREAPAYSAAVAATLQSLDPSVQRIPHTKKKPPDFSEGFVVGLAGLEPATKGL